MPGTSRIGGLGPVELTGQASMAELQGSGPVQESCKDVAERGHSMNCE